MFNKAKIKNGIVLLAASFVVTMGSVSAYESFHGPTELIYSAPAKAASGYLLFSPYIPLEEHQFLIFTFLMLI